MFVSSRAYLDPPSVVEAHAYPDDAAAWARSSAPGAQVVVPLAAAAPRRLSRGGQVDALVAYERHGAWLAAQQYRLLAVLAADAASASASPAEALDKQWIREDVRAALGLSAVTAGLRLALAHELTSRLADTLAALERGVIGDRHVRALSDVVGGLGEEQVQRVQAVALSAARVAYETGGAMMSLVDFRRTSRRARQQVEQATEEERHVQAVLERSVRVTPMAEGMSYLSAYLPAEGSALVMAALDRAVAASSGGDVRTADQIRADALVQLAIDAGTCSVLGCVSGSVGGTVGGVIAGAHDGSASTNDTPLPKYRDARPAINVSVALSTLLDLDDQPAELEGHGPIPAALARRLACDPTGTWRRLVTDPVGGLVDAGRSTYRPPAALARHVALRDRTCRFPSCNRRARDCDLDHHVPWSRGGTTSAENLGALCPRHHQMRHDNGWSVSRDDHGNTRWISPTGHRYTVFAKGYPVDATTTPADMTHELGGQQMPSEHDPPF